MANNLWDRVHQATTGANNVHNKPNGTVKGQISEHAVLAILPRPAGWTGAYPHTDGVTVTGNPECDTKMVWWQVQRSGAARPAGWVSEGDIVEWFLAPLTLEY